MNTWEIDQEVIKGVCRPNCQCDGKEIPPGTVGVIEEITQRSWQSIPESEPYLRVKWALRPRKTWWVYEHALVEPTTIPDMFYLDL